MKSLPKSIAESSLGSREMPFAISDETADWVPMGQDPGPVKVDLACNYSEAELNHLRDGLAMTYEQRWQWLREAMDFGYRLARSRAASGLTTLGPQGEVLWSGSQEIQWQAQHAGP